MSAPTLVVHSKKDTFDEYIGRGSRFGNPYVIRSEADREQVIEQFRYWVADQPELLRLTRQVLQSKRLGCFCHPLACHGDTLAEIADGGWDDIIPPEPIFVFGSNLGGFHKKGAAQFASRYYQAANYIGFGRTGHAYAIPTKTKQLEIRSLIDIHRSVDEFHDYASQHPNLQFLLTRVGCGLAEYRNEEIAPLFKNAPANVLKPGQWLSLENPEVYRIIIAGGRDFKDYRLLSHKLDGYLSRIAHLPLEIVSGGANGADTLGERYAIERGYRLRRIPAYWEALGTPAGYVRNRLMSFYATHTICFWDGASKGTLQMINIAKADGMPLKVIPYR